MIDVVAPRTAEVPTDAALVERIVRGDAHAFETVMRRYNRRLYRLARATLRDDGEAEDALQDAYLQAYRSMHQFRGDAALPTWLSRLVLNACFARLRRNQRRAARVPTLAPGTPLDLDTMIDDHSEGPAEAALRAELRELLERRIDALPEEFRTVFMLRSVEEMSVEETAQCLGIPEATVRSRHFRARTLLRESLAREIDDAQRDVFTFGGAHCDRVVSAVLAAIRTDGPAEA